MKRRQRATHTALEVAGERILLPEEAIAEGKLFDAVAGMMSFDRVAKLPRRAREESLVHLCRRVLVQDAPREEPRAKLEIPPHLPCMRHKALVHRPE